MLGRVDIAGYRSIRALTLELGRITVLVGPNGCGKTNCYRALTMMHAAALGRLAEHFAEEGGMPSALWAGEREHREEVRLAVAVELDEFTYRLACGLPTPRRSVFTLDPEVKEEDVGARLPGRKTPVPLVERRNQVVTLRGEQGERMTYTDPLDLAESVLSQVSDPKRFGELALLRHALSRWRFYHQFRSDAASPLRQPRLGVRSPILASDGLNLAAAMQTIVEMDRGDELSEAITSAFPGAEWRIERDEHGRMAVGMRMPGIPRWFAASELSDGTLRFLCLAAALLSPRPPEFLALNEPETSLHGDLLPALAKLIATAAERSQVLVTTHARELAERLAAEAGCHTVELRRTDTGETTSGDDRGLLARPRRPERGRGGGGGSR
jgi:predicted ATPase